MDLKRAPDGAPNPHLSATVHTMRGEGTSFGATGHPPADERPQEEGLTAHVFLRQVGRPY